MRDDSTPNPKIEQNLHDLLGSSAPEATFENRLRASLIAQAAQIKPGPLSRRFRLRWAYVFLVVLLLVIVFSPQIVTAMRRLFGYVPGVGLVEQSVGIRILAEPVTDKRDGLTVTVLKVVADSTHTFVKYGVSGIPPVTEGFPVCGAMPTLRLPDGSDLDFMSGGGFGMNSEGGQPMAYETDYNFASVPAGVENLTFILPCVLPTPGTGPENWEIPLKLVPAPADFATPGVEIAATAESSGPRFETTPTLTPEASVTPQPEATLDLSLPPTPTTVPNGSGLYLDKVIVLEKSYLLIGNFTDAGDLPGTLEISSESDVLYRLHFEDADGKPVLVKQRTDIQPEVNWGGVYYWAYEVPKPVNAPLKITLAQVNLSTEDTAQFQVDAGEEPQPGQVLTIDQSLTLGGYKFIVDTVTILKKGYLFRLHSGLEVPEGTSFSLRMLNAPPAATGNDWASENRYPKDRVEYSENFITGGPVPSGLQTFELTLWQSISLPGPWTLTWSPPK